MSIFEEYTQNIPLFFPSKRYGKILFSDNKKIGRNEKCPCGSGKKYKHCHGAL